MKVGETEEEKGKPNYVNFKRVVWHNCFRKLLESLSLILRTGNSVTCGDGIIRHLFPFIIILAADYEEQYAS